MGVGIIPVELDVLNNKIGFIQMRQQKPTFGQRLNQISRIAKALSIDIHEVEETKLPVEVVSCGLPFLYVPIKSLHTVEQMRPDFVLLGNISEELGARGAFIFTQETVQPFSINSSGTVSDKEIPDLRVHSRMFAPGVGVYEDPATGSASGPLGCYLVKNGVIPPKPIVKIISEQGYEIERPSTLYIEIHMVDNDIVDVRVGGYVIPVAKGTLFVE